MSDKNGLKSSNEPEQVFVVTDWEKHYESAYTQKLKTFQWIPVPINLSGTGYSLLMTEENGPAIFGAFVAILEVAARCEIRGILTRSNGKPHTARTLASMTRMPTDLILQALNTLQDPDIGWISAINNHTLLARFEEIGVSLERNPENIERKTYSTVQDLKASERARTRTHASHKPIPKEEDRQRKSALKNGGRQKGRRQEMAVLVGGHLPKDEGGCFKLAGEISERFGHERMPVLVRILWAREEGKNPPEALISTLCNPKHPISQRFEDQAREILNANQGTDSARVEGLVTSVTVEFEPTVEEDIKRLVQRLEDNPGSNDVFKLVEAEARAKGISIKDLACAVKL